MRAVDEKYVREVWMRCVYEKYEREVLMEGVDENCLWKD